MLKFLDKSIKTILGFLDGKKTNIVAILIGVFKVLQLLEIISLEQFNAILAVLGAFGLLAVRDAIRKVK